MDWLKYDFDARITAFCSHKETECNKHTLQLRCTICKKSKYYNYGDTWLEGD